jgi:hypothetical protein
MGFQSLNDVLRHADKQLTKIATGSRFKTGVNQHAMS